MRQLCNGPAKLVQAMGITKDYNGIDLLNPNSSLHIEFDDRPHTYKVIVAPRIGIRMVAHELRRWLVADSPYVSRPAKTSTTKV